MGEALHSFWPGKAGSPRPGGWWWHSQLKKPLFGRFMKPWRWPAGVAAEGWSQHRVASASHRPATARVTPQLATASASRPTDRT